MISSWMIVALLVTFAVVWVTSTPMLTPSKEEALGDVDFTQKMVLMDAKERSLRALKDLDLDFSMGKLSKDDHDQSRAALSQDVARILDELKRSER